MDLELRMYGLVPYNISEIQKGIQFGHGVVEYAQDHYNDPDYQEWASKYKTFIILNGGTSNHVSDIYGGSMESHAGTLLENGIKISTFNEPDLNDMLSSILFIVDERVFNREKYPDFDTKLFQGDFSDPMNPSFLVDSHGLDQMPGHSIVNKIAWENWVESIGGRQNLFLRNFLRGFRLA